jgi:pyruvyltransferase
VLALRGPKTREAVTMTGPEPVLADPGLLADLLLPADGRPKQQHDIGAIGHYADKTFSPPAGSLLIDVTAPLEQVVAQAASCERIYTSSLHGLILADALGLPRLWATYPKVQGGGFKFHDYAGALGQSISPGVWQSAPAATVAIKKQQLREALACVK